MPELSVIIPCFNAQATLGQQLEALSTQVCERSWEVVLSDNGSNDASVAVAESYRHRLPELQVVDSSKVRGASHARNLGVAAARGTYLIFCDADDEVADGWLQAMADALDQHPVVAGVMNTDNRLNTSWSALAFPMEDGGLSVCKYPPHLLGLWGANLAYRREVMQRVGPWDESLHGHEDMEYGWRAQLAGYRVHVADNAVVHYRLRSTLGGLYRQAQLWGEGEMRLRLRYDPTLKPRQLLRRVVWLLRHVPHAPWFAPSKARWAGWIWELGHRVGQVRAVIPSGKDRA